MEKLENRTVLFYCATTFQLFNTLNLVINGGFQGDVIDVMIDNASPLEQYIPALEQLGFFREVLQYDYLSLQQEWKNMNFAQRMKASQKPLDLVKYDWGERTYTDIYVANAWAAHKLIYYSLVQSKIYPKIHLYEDGTVSYAMRPFDNYETEGIDHDFFKGYGYKKKIVELLIYQPDLFTGKILCPVNQLPRICRESEEIQKVYRTVYGYEELPKEKYIFFEEASIQDQYPCNDFELFEMVAKEVGKENIIVKRHPRNRVDRFSAAGYRVMENQTIPWEVCLLQNDVSDKVLVTITSGATMTPQLIFEEAADGIHLAKMLQGFTPTTYHPQFFGFHKRLAEWSNQNDTVVYQPTSMMELKEVIKYISAKHKYRENHKG